MRTAVAIAKDVGFPVMIKASAGGGGRYADCSIGR